MRKSKFLSLYWTSGVNTPLPCGSVAEIMPVISGSSTTNAGKKKRITVLGHSCMHIDELKHVINEMRADLDAIEKDATRRFSAE